MILEFVIQEDKRMLNAIEKFNTGGTENDLFNDVINLIRPSSSSMKLKSVLVYIMNQLTSPEDEMLINRKKGWNNVPHTVENFVDSVAEIHDNYESKQISEPPKSGLLMGGMKTCNIGQSPEVQPRDLLNI